MKYVKYIYFDHFPPKTKLGISAIAWDEVSLLIPLKASSEL